MHAFRVQYICLIIAFYGFFTLGKGLDYREIGDKFGIGTSTACMKVNEAMKLLVSSKMHIIRKLQRGIDFQRIINGFQRKWNFP